MLLQIEMFCTFPPSIQFQIIDLLKKVPAKGTKNAMANIKKELQILMEKIQ